MHLNQSKRNNTMEQPQVAETAEVLKPEQLITVLNYDARGSVFITIMPDGSYKSDAVIAQNIFHHAFGAEWVAEFLPNDVLEGEPVLLDDVFMYKTGFDYEFFTTMGETIKERFYQGYNVLCNADEPVLPSVKKEFVENFLLANICITALNQEKIEELAKDLDKITKLMQEALSLALMLPGEAVVKGIPSSPAYALCEHNTDEYDRFLVVNSTVRSFSDIFMQRDEYGVPNPACPVLLSVLNDDDAVACVDGSRTFSFNTLEEKDPETQEVAFYDYFVVTDPDTLHSVSVFV